MKALRIALWRVMSSSVPSGLSA